MPLFKRQKQADPQREWWEAYSDRPEVSPEMVYPLIRNALDQRLHTTDLGTAILEKGRGLDMNNPAIQKQVTNSGYRTC